MKKFLSIVLVLTFTAFFADQSQAANYKLNDAKVDALFETAPSAEMNVFNSAAVGMENIITEEVEGKDPLVAILLDFFLGGLGVHRFYLGTKTLTGLGYIFTCGGIFGVVPLVDLIMLAINYEDISPFVDNPKFFMW
jgi:TM2 domain-containing membrane protein YozV